MPKVGNVWYSFSGFDSPDLFVHTHGFASPPGLKAVKTDVRCTARRAGTRVRDSRLTRLLQFDKSASTFLLSNGFMGPGSEKLARAVGTAPHARAAAAVALESFLHGGYFLHVSPSGQVGLKKRDADNFEAGASFRLEKVRPALQRPSACASGLSHGAHQGLKGCATGYVSFRALGRMGGGFLVKARTGLLVARAATCANPTVLRRTPRATTWAPSLPPRTRSSAAPLSSRSARWFRRCAVQCMGAGALTRWLLVQFAVLRADALPLKKGTVIEIPPAAPTSPGAPSWPAVPRHRPHLTPCPPARAGSNGFSNRRAQRLLELDIPDVELFALGREETRVPGKPADAPGAEDEVSALERAPATRRRRKHSSPRRTSRPCPTTPVLAPSTATNRPRASPRWACRPRSSLAARRTPP